MTLYYYKYFHELFGIIKSWDLILLIKTRVQLFYIMVLNIINCNFGLVKSWQISPKPIGARILFVPLVPSQATH